MVLSVIKRLIADSFLKWVVLNNTRSSRHVRRICFPSVSKKRKKEPAGTYVPRLGVVLDYRALAAETVEGAALALKSVHHIHCRHSLPASVPCVGHRVADDVLQEYLEHTACFLVDRARDALYTATTTQPAVHGLGDTLDVVA